MRLSRLLGQDGTGSDKVDRACAAIGEKLTEWTIEHPREEHRILVDQAVRHPYSRLQESKGPLNQIMIRTEADELVDLGERSKVVKAIEPFRLFRVYHSTDDQEARDLISRMIDEESRR
jgi:hypothetical protein